MLNFKSNELSEINNENTYFMGSLLLLPSKHCIIYTLVLGVPIFLGTPSKTRWRPGDFTIEAVVSYPVYRDQWLSLFMTKWLRKWRRGWRYIHTNAKIAKSLLHTRKRLSKRFFNTSIHLSYQLDVNRCLSTRWRYDDDLTFHKSRWWPYFSQQTT